MYMYSEQISKRRLAQSLADYVTCVQGGWMFGLVEAGPSAKKSVAHAGRSLFPTGSSRLDGIILAHGFGPVKTSTMYILHSCSFKPLLNFVCHTDTVVWQFFDVLAWAGSSCHGFISNVCQLLPSQWNPLLRVVPFSIFKHIKLPVWTPLPLITASDIYATTKRPKHLPSSNQANPVQCFLCPVKQPREIEFEKKTAPENIYHYHLLGSHISYPYQR